MHYNYYMNKKIITLLFLILFSTSAMALRCGNRLVIEGDSQFSVIRACGKPAFENTYYETKYRYFQGIRSGYGREVSIKIDEWTYNFGRTRLVYTLIFENGYLVDIKTDQGYGYRD